MSRRFSDEPINLIHRIPTPEQLASARPSKRSFGQTIAEMATTYARAAVDAVFRITHIDRTQPPQTHASSASVEHLDDSPEEALPDSLDPPDLRPPQASDLIHPVEAVVPSSQPDATVPLLASPSSAVQPEEVAELRAYLLSQQEDIARLSGQIQELKSMVLSQQQVLVYLGKELETGSLSSPTRGVASAGPKRTRAIRQKPIMKENVMAQKADAKSASPELWPAPPRRADV
jgi:hypothetical protein